ncbi:MAG: hypothetical protein ACKKL5_03850 [Candidatus Komeilibacteria bacterium]
MSLGLLIIFITIIGYISNWLNGRWLNWSITRWLYYLGAVIHETSHVILCIVTGAKITEFKIFTSQPHVTHGRPRLPWIGQMIISLAPLIGGLTFIYIINKYLLQNYWQYLSINNFAQIPDTIWHLLSQINILEWQSWLTIILLLNIGAMIGPSTKDLKNIWPALILLLFVNWPPLLSIAFFIFTLICLNILIQLILITIKQFLHLLFR